MKHLLSTLCLSLLLFTSCGGTAPTISTKPIEDNRFVMGIYSSWQELPASSIESSLPAGTFRIFQNPVARDGLFSRLTILTEELAEPTSSIEYAKARIEETPNVVKGYILEQTGEITINGTPTLLHIYRGSASALSPELLFIQSFVVVDSTESYTLTFSIAPSARLNGALMESYVGLLSSFKSPIQQNQ